MSQLHMSSKTSIVLLLLVQDLLWLVVGLLWVGVWGFFLVGCWVCFGFGGGGFQSYQVKKTVDLF